MRRAYIVAGLGYGDEGKGATVDFLTWQRDAKLVVRYNGGSQAGHNVVQPDGRHHTFSQFGSGSFHPGVKTHLSRFMLVNPINMLNEEDHLRELGVTDAFERTTVEDEALIITPFHRAVNRAMSKVFTTCGEGIGVCREFHLAWGFMHSLFAGNLIDEKITKGKLGLIKKLCLEVLELNRRKTPEILRDEEAIDRIWTHYKAWTERVRIVPSEYLEEMLHVVSTVVFEGAQGVLLDETLGESGLNTWTNTTFENAERLLEEYVGEKFRIGVTRTYSTRHGAGPLESEDLVPRDEPHNDGDGYQGHFRTAPFNRAKYEFALKALGGVDGVVFNHCDVAGPPDFVSDVETWLHGYGPTYNDRHWCL